ASDANQDRLAAWVDAGTILGTLTVASNTIASIAADMVVAVDLPDIRRYLYMQYNAHDAQDRISVVFVGEDLEEAPFTGARTGY
ncbi:MAG TPA: hypothetical protein VFH53_10140, partial [Phycisphaerae bacterium]|nr:hypothetical protein [Phycisphaerae bacterium]